MKKSSSLCSMLSLVLALCLALSPVAGAFAEGTDAEELATATEATTVEAAEAADADAAAPAVADEAGDVPVGDTAAAPAGEADDAAEEPEADEAEAAADETAAAADPVDETPVEETPAEETPAEVTDAQDKTVADAPAEEPEVEVPEITILGAPLLEGDPQTVTVSAVDASAKAVVKGAQLTFTAKVVSNVDYYLVYVVYVDGSPVMGGDNAALPANTNTLTITANTAGTYKVTMKAYNLGTNEWQSQADSADVVVADKAFNFSAVNVNDTYITLGKEIVFTPVLEGGSGNVNLTYNVYKGSTMVTTNTTTTTAPYSYVPTETGTYYCVVSVQDTIFNLTTTRTSTSVIVVENLKIDTITPSALLLAVGSPVTFTTTVSGGVAPYTYDYVLKKSGVENDIMAGSSSSVFASTPGSAGKYQLFVTVHDAKGNEFESTSAEVEFVDPIRVTLVKPDYTLTETNIPLTFTVSYEGNPTSFYWEIKNNNEVVYSMTTTTPSLSYTPTTPGSYTATVTASYASGTQKISATGTSAVVTVQEELKLHGVTTETNVYQLDSTITFTVVTSGGITPMDYVFKVFKKVSGSWVQQQLITNQTGTLKYTPTSIGEYYCEAGVKDAWHEAYLYADSAVLDVVPAIVFNTVSVSSTTVPVGEEITFTPVISGGTGSYTFIYCVFNSKKQLTMVQTTDPNFKYTPTEPDAYYCTVYAADDRYIWTHVSSAKVTVLNSIASVSATLSTMATYKNTTVKATASTVGAAAFYCFRVYDPSGSMVHEEFTTKNTYSFKPTAVGHYTVDVLAYDQIKWTAAPTLHMDVYEPFVFTKVNLSALGGVEGDTIYIGSDAANGVPAIQYIYCVYDSHQQLLMAQTTATTYPFTFDHADTYRVTVFACDGTGVWTSRTVKGIKITSASVLGIKDITVNTTAASVGDPLTYTTTTTGGAINYIHCVFRNGQQMTMTVSSSPVFTYTPTSEGSYQITVYATDGVKWVHKTSSMVTTVSSGGALKINSVTPSATTINLGSPVTFTTTVSGAVGSVTYIHCVFDSSKQLTMTYSSSNAFPYTPKTAGSYHIEVYATDSRGVWVKASSVEVNVINGAALKLGVTVSSTDLIVHDVVTITPNATGGNGSYKYIYCLFRDSKQLTMDESTASSMSYQLDSAGTYRVDVYCTDSTEQWIMQSSATIKVSGT